VREKKTNKISQEKGKDVFLVPKSMNRKKILTANDAISPAKYCSCPVE
jgi:predicted Rossmann fold nucleotide-binding protein DprA/Smf involved in DNA uptake